MSERLEQAIMEATLHVFETSTYMNVLPRSESGSEPLTEPDIAAKMIFRGPMNGTLTMRVASELLGELVSNMLGELGDNESVEEKGQDALKEIANMICGNMLTLWAGEQPVFKLSPPNIVVQEPDKLSAEPVCTKVSFVLENTLAEITVEYDHD